MGANIKMSQNPLLTRSKACPSQKQLEHNPQTPFKHAQFDISIMFAALMVTEIPTVGSVEKIKTIKKGWTTGRFLTFSARMH